MDTKSRKWLAIVIFVALGILIVTRLILNKPQLGTVPFAAPPPITRESKSFDGHSSSIAKGTIDETIDAQRKLGMARGALLNTSFPYELGALRTKLREDVSFAVDFPEPERGLMLATIGERFATQFSTAGESVNLLLKRLMLYEDVLREFDYSVDSGGFSFRSVIECVTDSDMTKISGLEEDTVIQAYRDSKSKLIGRIAGVVIAQRLATMGSKGLTEIDAIEDKVLRNNTEREAIRLLASVGGDDLAGAISYYMSPKSELENEHPYVVELIGSAFNKFPEATSQVVFDAPKGLKRDSAIVQMVVRMGKEDPEAALAWIKEISDPGIRWKAGEFYHKRPSLSQIPLPEHSNAPDPFAQ